MIEVTNFALEVLDEALKASKVAKDEGLCIRRKNGMLILDLKKPNPTDRVVTRYGRIIYMVDPNDETQIGRGFIDVCNTDDGLQLVFRQFGLTRDKERINRINSPSLAQIEIDDNKKCFGCGIDLEKRN